MLEVTQWSIYDLGKVYGFSIGENEIQIQQEDKTKTWETPHTYIRLVFLFDSRIKENVDTMTKDKIDWQLMSDGIQGYFTTDITYFPTDKIPLLKNCGILS